MYKYTIAKITNGWLLTVTKPQQEHTTSHFFETKFGAFTKLAEITIESLKQQESGK